MVLHKTMGFRIAEDDEVAGIDLAVHAESGYDLHTATTGGRTGVLAAATAGLGRPGPERTLAEETQPEETQPGETQPGETQPGETQPEKTAAERKVKA
jgi:Amt family ammonium transporter